jgi:hypothetical protein
MHLYCRDPDEIFPFHIHIDASHKDIGATLGQ